MRWRVCAQRTWITNLGMERIVRLFVALLLLVFGTVVLPSPSWKRNNTTVVFLFRFCWFPCFAGQLAGRGSQSSQASQLGQPSWAGWAAALPLFVPFPATLFVFVSQTSEPFFTFSTPHATLLFQITISEGPAWKRQRRKIVFYGQLRKLFPQALGQEDVFSWVRWQALFQKIPQRRYNVLGKSYAIPNVTFR